MAESGDDTMTTTVQPTESTITPSKAVKPKIIKACLQCGKDFEVRAKKNFCSKTCRYRYFSRKEYHRIKSNPDFKARRKEYEKQWRLKNKDKWNASMKLASQRYRMNHPKKPEVKVEETTNGDM